MRRSEINRAIDRAKTMLGDFTLPCFGYWTIEDWRRNKDITGDITKLMLGWDVTDYGFGRFDELGAVLFTIRNGLLGDDSVGTPYAEKLIFLTDTEQEIPFHFHVMKTEDIINRGGGVLMLELYNSFPDGSLDRESPVSLKMDGITRTFAAGEFVEVERGNSVMLPPRLSHRFWAKKGGGDLLVGEVSSINDDRTDNVFMVPMARFVGIEEDEAIVHPLCNEYEAVL